MRWTRWTVLASTLAALAAAATLSCTTAMQKAAPAAMTDAQKVERGQYLTTIMGCNDCHTPGTFYGAPDFSRKLSGSELGWVGPWGTTYARNLTPDMETGIGSWSADDIVKTIRTGQRADGTTVLPPMPWPMYTNLTDDDAYSIAAYLKSLPAVSHPVPHRQPPGAKPAKNDWVLPEPLAWDAPKTPPGGAAAETTAVH
jgi:mono/diheme cytochrome c family protein